MASEERIRQLAKDEIRKAAAHDAQIRRAEQVYSTHSGATRCGSCGCNLIGRGEACDCACHQPAPRLVSPWRCGECGHGNSWLCPNGERVCVACGWSRRLQVALDVQNSLRNRLKNVLAALKGFSA